MGGYLLQQELELIQLTHFHSKLPDSGTILKRAMRWVREKLRSEWVKCRAKVMHHWTEPQIFSSFLSRMLWFFEGFDIMFNIATWPHLSWPWDKHPSVSSCAFCLCLDTSAWEVKKNLQINQKCKRENIHRVFPDRL